MSRSHHPRERRLRSDPIAGLSGARPKGGARPWQCTRCRHPRPNSTESEAKTVLRDSNVRSQEVSPPIKGRNRWRMLGERIPGDVYAANANQGCPRHGYIASSGPYGWEAQPLRPHNNRQNGRERVRLRSPTSNARPVFSLDPPGESCHSGLGLGKQSGSSTTPNFVPRRSVWKNNELAELF